MSEFFSGFVNARSSSTSSSLSSYSSSLSVPSRYYSLTALYVPFCSALDDQALELLAKHCPHLRSVSFLDFALLSCSHQAAVSASVPITRFDISTVNFRNNSLITASGIAILVKGCRHIAEVMSLLFLVFFFFFPLLLLRLCCVA
jgi:hypothetical protein